MNLNMLPIIGWALDIFLKGCMAIPFWFLWTYYGFGKYYFYWLPDVYKDMPFLNIVALFVIIGILKAVILPSFNTTVESSDSE